MKYEEIFNHPLLLLPKAIPAKMGFRTFITEKLNEYLELLNTIDGEEFIVSGLNKPKRKKTIISIQGRFIKGILKVIDHYYDGKPAEAYKSFESTMNTRLKRNKNLLNMKFFDEFETFYRIRMKSENFSFTKAEMFHIPFELRGMVSTQRYSIPGFPSLYLSKTLYAAWEELRRPKASDFQAIRLTSRRPISYLDLTPPDWGEDNSSKNAYRYLMAWPLMLCCSIKVKNYENTFKPEYIVSQLLLQWVRNNDEVSGIKFNSSHIKYPSIKTRGDLYNLVLPVRENKDKGYCDHLLSLFHVTEPTSWQLLEFATGGTSFMYSEKELDYINKKIPGGVELIRGRKYPYSYSTLGMLEYYLDGLDASRIQ